MDNASRMAVINTIIVQFAAQDIQGVQADIVRMEELVIGPDNADEQVVHLKVYLRSVLAEKLALERSLGELRQIVPSNAQETNVQTNLLALTEQRVNHLAQYINQTRAMMETGFRGELAHLQTHRDQHQVGSVMYNEYNRRYQVKQVLHDALREVLVPPQNNEHREDR